GYFAWNFFDPILVQKEGYSDYAFEEIATEYVNTHRNIREALTLASKNDTTLAKNASDQLQFVYEHSEFPEPRLMRFPVYRVVDSSTINFNDIPVKNIQGVQNKKDE
ncbi:MAG TPA: hypothetical protein PLU10_02485, partial [Chitinophagaceae bacterium]|nr:hypothetical protein [Chitinophagaceae bacterium]